MNSYTGTKTHAASRREFLMRSCGGLGALASSSMLQAADPPAAKQPDHTPTAKSVIWLFMEGGPSHIDIFDPKPELEKLAGQPMPASFGKVVTAMGTASNTLMPSSRTWKQYGQSGMWVSDWYTNMAQHVDDITLFRSCWADGLNHVGSVCQMNTGSILAGRPSLGAWVNYGLGTENQNLPGFVVLLDNDREPPGGNRVWGTGFMPATFQGTRFRNGKTPVLHLATPEELDETQQRYKLDYINQLNRRHLETRSGDFDLEARIAAYELAFRMQAETPAAVDLSQETRATQELYGLDDKATSAFGRNCLLARRLVERGVRFVQLYSGSGSQWDAHSKIEENHTRLCRSTDKPIAGLLKDLKGRGLLE